MRVTKKNSTGSKIMVGVGICVLLLVLACLGYSFFRFPAKQSAQAILDMTYKGTTESYNYKKLTGNTEKEVEALYKENMQTHTEPFKQYFGVEELTEEGEEILQIFVENIYKNYVSYNVKSSRKKGNTYTITIKVRPLAFSEILDEKKFAKEFRQKTEDGEYLTYDNAQYQSAYIEELISQYEKSLEDNVPYEDKKSIKIKLKKSGNQYVLDSEDISELDKALIVFN